MSRAFSFESSAKRTIKSNDATRYVKIGYKQHKISKRNYYIISPRVIKKPSSSQKGPAVAYRDTKNEDKE